MLQIGMCVGCVKINLSYTAKIKRSRSQRQIKIVHKNIKYMPQTSSDSGNSGLIGNRGGQSEWQGQIFDRKLLNSRFSSCTVKIFLNVA